MRNTLVPALVGFDDIFDRVFGSNFNPPSLSDRKATLFDTAYPKYNLIKNDNGYVIELALAGFSKEELSVTTSNGVLTVSGKKEEKASNFLHQGISSKSFTRVFDLNSNLEIGDVDFVDGILSIQVNRIDGREDIRKIEIK